LAHAQAQKGTCAILVETGRSNLANTSSQYEGQDVPSAHVNEEWMFVHQQRCSLLKKKLTMDKTGKDHSEMSLDGVDSVFAV
jgi:hypothetical protein